MTQETWEAFKTLSEVVGILVDRIPRTTFDGIQDARSLNRKLDDLRHFLEQCPIEVQGR